MNLSFVFALTQLTLLSIFLPTIVANRCVWGAYSESNDAVTCKPCPAGNYCPYNNTLRPDLGTLLKACPAGTYMPHPGADSLSDCLQCEIGTYSGNASTNCSKCPASYTCTDPAQTPVPASTILSSNNVTAVRSTASMLTMGVETSATQPVVNTVTTITAGSSRTLENVAWHTLIVMLVLKMMLNIGH